ncbi:unnamed protein product [Peronospora destructor]|uniref:Uncharacterized protein n=1 Tax=Peronospora destructor TaxID=86335 RepID=A0AAV0VHG6_9STRA|nr:unnamed protein product [Peronospora destructor]
MSKSADHHAAVEEEFLKLEHVLNQTAGDTSACLKLLKKHLSEYDSRNSNHLSNTATSYMKTDMRIAKDAASSLKHVADEMSKSRASAKTEASSARNMMDATAKAMETLKITARNYDKENKQSKGIKGTIDAAMGGHHNKDKDEKHGLFGKADTHKHKDGGLLGTKDKNGGGILGSTDTVEGLVEKTLRDNFSLIALDHQITATKKALSPSMMERAKEKMHDVKDKLTGDKTSPTHETHHSKHM